jgi:hypothetical protein
MLTVRKRGSVVDYGSCYLLRNKVNFLSNIREYRRPPHQPGDWVKKSRRTGCACECRCPGRQRRFCESRSGTSSFLKTFFT